MAIVVGSFYVRRQIGQRAWRTLHYVTFLAFLGATAHGVMAGTDSGTPVGVVDLRRLDDRRRLPARRTGSRCRSVAPTSDDVRAGSRARPHWLSRVNRVARTTG